jgi:hypothetical protein
MNLRRSSIALLLVFVILSGIQAQEPETQKPATYRLELVYIFESTKTEYIFVIGNSGFKTVVSLKAFIASLPPGSALEWAPGCIRFGDEPLLSSEEEMNSFQVFCLEKGIKFTLIPSG